LTSAHPAFDVRIFHKECKALARAGYEVVLIAPAEEDGTYDGITIKHLRVWKSRLARLTGGPLAAYRNALEVDADVYHFHDPELIPVAMLLRLQGKNVIYDIHEDLPRTISYKPYIPRFLRGSVSRAAESIENWAARRCSALVAATPTIENRFRRVNKNLVVLNNYPKIEEIESSVPSVDNGAEGTLLYVGMRITRARGAEEMVRSMGLLPRNLRARLKLVGQWGTPDLPEALSKIPGWERTTFVGPLGRKEVARELQNACVGLVILHPEPNYVASQPVKLFEYMCAGIPVIVSDFPVCRQIVEQAGCGIVVNPLDAHEIAGAMEFLLTHPEEAEQMGRRGLQAILERYNWANEEKTLLQLYGDLFRHDAAREAQFVGKGETA
jgi:glycosyltransferase involved in cell wall biosynthesis